MTSESTATLDDSAVPQLPVGRYLELPGRGVTYFREHPGPQRPASKRVPVVFLFHGWGATADLNFFRCFETLGKHYRVIAMDARGHGRGIRPKLYFRLEDCADDAVALADALGIDTFIPVGYSMGGAIAQLVAHRHPTRTAGLVLCSTAGIFRSEGSPERAVWNGVMPAIAAALTFTPAAIRQNLLNRFLLVRKEPGTPDWMLREIGRNDPAVVVQAGLALGRFDSSPWLNELGARGSSGIETAIVLTTNDHTVPPSRQRRLAAGIPGSHLFEVAADHRAAVTSPQKFLPKLLEALKVVSAGSLRAKSS